MKLTWKIPRLDRSIPAPEDSLVDSPRIFFNSYKKWLLSIGESAGEPIGLSVNAARCRGTRSTGGTVQRFALADEFVWDVERHLSNSCLRRCVAVYELRLHSFSSSCYSAPWSDMFTASTASFYTHMSVHRWVCLVRSNCYGPSRSEPEKIRCLKTFAGVLYRWCSASSSLFFLSFDAPLAFVSLVDFWFVKTEWNISRQNSRYGHSKSHGNRRSRTRSMNSSTLTHIHFYSQKPAQNEL